MTLRYRRTRNHKGKMREDSGGAISIRLLGVPEWQRLGDDPVRFTAKDAALVTKLALDGPQPRAHICGLLWPDSSSEKGYASLRTRAHRLKLAANTSIIEIDDHIRLGAGVSVDVLEIENMDTSSLLRAGQLLTGVDLGNLDDLDRWLSKVRIRVAESFATVLGARAQALERDGNLDDALALARRAVEIAPLSEVSWLRMMTLQYLRGDRAAAQDTYYRCATVLRDEMGTRPGVPMRELMQTVEAAERPPVSRHHPIPASVLRPPTLIGRIQAWQAMWAAWQQGHPFLVMGEAGLGKTRLLQEYCRGQQGVASERAAPGDEEDPFKLLGRLLVHIDRQFAPVLSAEDRAELARVRLEFGVKPDTPPNAAVLERALEAMLAASLTKGLRAIVLDDLHNADPSTLALLRRLSGRPALANLRLGLASRPTGPAASLSILAAWTEDSHRLVRVELSALSQAELSELLGSLMLPSLVDPQFAERMFRHAGGHPLFTLATLHAALAGGADPRAARLPRPGSIKALLDARIEGVPRRSQQLLRVAAIAGRDLTAERVARMLDCSVLALADRWADLEAADILRGGAFSHDLVHEAALRTVPGGVRQALHRQFAAVLAVDADAAPARLAWHWEQGERPLEAGRCWHDAANRAAAAALLTEQSDLFLRAARSYEAAGDNSARFEALCTRLERLQLRPGGAAVLEALPEVEALADTGLRRLRCRLARAEALLGVERAIDAEAHARTAVVEAKAYPDLIGDAEALHAQTLVQSRQFDAAEATAARAIASAESAGNRWQLLRALQGSSFVSYAIGRIPEALSTQRQAVTLAEAIGHRYEAAAGEGHVAALLAIIGDVPGSYEQASRAGARLRDVGIDADGVFGAVNDRVLGSAAAAMGRFDEALDSLQRAVKSAGPKAAPGALVRAQLALATLWLTLGRADLARKVLLEVPTDPEPARQALQQLLLAQAAESEGLPSQRHWAALSKIGMEHSDLPLMRSAVFELSYQGAPEKSIERLQAVRRQLETLGLHGTARSVLWRELARWLDIAGPAATVAALELAQQLAPHVDHGLSARCHPPLVWLALSQAFARAVDRHRHEECLQRARRWLEDAIPTVPAEFKESFLRGNPLHRRILGGTSS